jgi:hypothetical protein
MPHQPNLEKRARYEDLQAKLSLLFDAYSGGRSALIRTAAEITGLRPAEIHDCIGWMLDEFTVTNPADWSVIRANAPRHLAERAVFGGTGEYKED